MKLLKKLTETPGIAGREERIREVIIAETKDLFDESRTDDMGNFVGRVKPGGKGASSAPKVLLACHIDEIGFYVRHIDDEGRLRVHPAGGFDPRNLFARRVLVQGKKDLLGVMNPGIKPIHISTEEERKQVPKVADFYIDLFLPKKEVDKLVRVGDPITMVQTLERIGDMYTGKSLDNRVATWVAINALRKVGKRSKYDIYYVATVQEEVGLRGAGPSAYGIEPDIGLCIDTTLCCDTPGVDKSEAITRLGDGVGLKVMDGRAITHRGLLDEFIKLAEKEKIPYQLEILPQGGTDTAPLQMTGKGRRTMAISIPTRYIHTVTEAVHQRDLQAAVDVLAAWLCV